MHKVQKVDTSVQVDLSEEENSELLCELPFCPYTCQDPKQAANIQSPSNLPTEQSRRISTAFSSRDQANCTNREATERKENSETSSLQEFSLIDSTLLQSGPRVASEVEEIREASEEPNSLNPSQETSAVDKSPDN